MDIAGLIGSIIIVWGGIYLNVTARGLGEFVLGLASLFAGLLGIIFFLVY